MSDVEDQLERWRADTLDVQDIVRSKKVDVERLYDVIENGKNCLLGILFAWN